MPEFWLSKPISTLFRFFKTSLKDGQGTVPSSEKAERGSRNERNMLIRKKL